MKFQSERRAMFLSFSYFFFKVTDILWRGSTGFSKDRVKKWQLKCETVNKCTQSCNICLKLQPGAFWYHYITFKDVLQRKLCAKNQL